MTTVLPQTPSVNPPTEEQPIVSLEEHRRGRTEHRQVLPKAVNGSGNYDLLLMELGQTVEDMLHDAIPREVASFHSAHVREVLREDIQLMVLQEVAAAMRKHIREYHS